jgi:hypothetical protein
MRAETQRLKAVAAKLQREKDLSILSTPSSSSTNNLQKLQKDLEQALRERIEAGSHAMQKDKELRTVRSKLQETEVALRDESAKRESAMDERTKVLARMEEVDGELRALKARFLGASHGSEKKLQMQGERQAAEKQRPLQKPNQLPAGGPMQKKLQPRRLPHLS